MTDQPAWYGGNKIPDSYLVKFRPKSKQHSGLPDELALFLDYIGDHNEPEGYAGKEYHA